MTRQFAALPISAAAALIAGVFMAGCGSTPELSSTWTTNAMAVDGNAGDWTSHLYDIKDAHITLGLKNDQEYLYLCIMAPEDQFRQQIVGPGMTVWMTSDKERKIGVHYPMGMMGRVPRTPDNAAGGFEDKEAMIGQALREMELLGPGKNELNRLPVIERSDVQAKIGSTGGTMVYELRVPLQVSTDHPYAVGAIPGSRVNVEIESGKFEASRRPQERMEREGPGSEGRDGGGEMRPPGRGGRGAGRPPRNGGDIARPAAIDFTAEIQLAQSPGK